MDTENVGIVGIFASDRGLTVLAIDCSGLSFYCRHSLGALEDLKVFKMGSGLICKIKLFSQNGLRSCLHHHFPQVSLWVPKFSPHLISRGGGGWEFFKETFVLFSIQWVSPVLCKLLFTHFIV